MALTKIKITNERNKLLQYQKQTTASFIVFTFLYSQEEFKIKSLSFKNVLKNKKKNKL